MTEDRFEEFLQEAAQAYNPPPPTPREEMWARIRSARAGDGRRSGIARWTSSPWVRWGIGLAAALAIGIGLGRMSALDEPAAPTVAENAEVDRRAGGLAYRLAAAEHLSRAEALLVGFQVDPGASGLDSGFARSAGDLLTETRLLLDSPAAEEPATRELLRDLELILVQLLHVSPNDEADELESIHRGLETTDLLPRLRSTVQVTAAGS